MYDPLKHLFLLKVFGRAPKERSFMFNVRSGNFTQLFRVRFQEFCVQNWYIAVLWDRNYHAKILTSFKKREPRKPGKTPFRPLKCPKIKILLGS